MLTCCSFGLLNRTYRVVNALLVFLKCWERSALTWFPVWNWEFQTGNQRVGNLNIKKFQLAWSWKKKVDSLWHFLIYVTLGHLSMFAYLTCIPLILHLLDLAVHLLLSHMLVVYEMVWRNRSSKITGCSLNFVRHNDLFTLIRLNVLCNKHLPFTNRYTKLYWLIDFLCC